MTKTMKETLDVVKDGKEVKLAVLRPNAKIGREAQVYFNKAFNDALTSKAPFRNTLDTYMREQNLWDDTKEKKKEQLYAKLAEGEKQLRQGGFKLSDAKKLAIEMRMTRFELRDLMAARTALDSNTAEGQAENARFNALVALCLVYDSNGERYYKSVDEYLEHAADTEAYQAAQLLGEMLFNLDRDYESNLPENKFLREYGFVDEKLRLVNKEGHLVDLDGRLIDEDGRYVDKDGNFVDKNGNPVTKEGEPVIEAKPFLDDEGKPVEKKKAG